MTRNEKILKHIDKDKRGLEIGPSYNPIAPKRDGYKVHSIDHLNKKELIEKYKPDPAVDINKIEDVDYIWHGESFVELTGKKKYYDWIIASHVIEHTPDLIAFLKDCDSVLKDDGIISLAVPDKRFCYDRFRPITGISKIIDSHYNKNSIHTLGTAVEHMLNVTTKSGQIAWGPGTIGDYKPIYDIDTVRGTITNYENQTEYVDYHNWCFVPHSFRLLLKDLYSLGYIPFKEVVFFTTDGCEFFISISRTSKENEMSRLAILKQIELELKDEQNTSEPYPITQSLRNIFRHVVKTFTSK